MKYHRIHLSSTNRLPNSVSQADCDFLVRIPNTNVITDAEIFVENLVMYDYAEAGEFLNKNSFNIRSRNFTDKNSFDTTKSYHNLLTRICGRHMSTDGFYYNYENTNISKHSLGYSVKHLDLNELLLNISITNGDNTAISTQVSWRMQILIVDTGYGKNKRVEFKQQYA